MSSDAKPSKGSPVKSVDLHVGDFVPGVPKKDAIIVADHVTRTFGGFTPGLFAAVGAVALARWAGLV